MELVSLDSKQKGFFDGTPITKGVRCVVNNESLLHMTHILLIIDLVMLSWQTHTQNHGRQRGWRLLSGKENGKSKEVKTPDGKKLKVLPVGIGIATCLPPNVMLKFHRSNESKTLSLQSTSNVMSSIAKKLAFMGNHKVQRSHNPNPMKKAKTQSSAAGAATKVSVMKSSTKSTQNETATKMKLQNKQMQTKRSAAAISTKVSREKLTLGKLNAYTIDWTDSRVTTLETTKYQKANNIKQTQESMITLLACQFKPVDIKVAFAALIGKVGGSAQTAFYPLPSQKAKLVESFLELVFNEKSMLVDTVKKPFQ